MRTFDITITYRDNTSEVITASQEQIIAEKDVVRFALIRANKAKSVMTIRTQEQGKNYSTLNYDEVFERCKQHRIRVEATNAEGYEDLTGYGARTDGRKNRFYIGRSTGWIPCYLEILRKDSRGGVQLFETGRTFRLLQ